MLVCPKPTTHLHKFQQADRMYVADLSQCLALEINNITWDILDLCPSFSSEEIIERLGRKYDPDLVIEALDSLAVMEQRGILFSNLKRDTPASEKKTSGRLKILVLQRSAYATDITKATGGVSVAHHSLVKSLETYASLDIVSESDEAFKENVRGIRFQENDRSTLLKLIGDNYDAILLESHQDTRFLSLLRYVDAPFVIPIYSARGHNGDVINAGLLWYAAMRPFDAFLVPTNSVRDVYGRFVCDKDIFHTIPLGLILTSFIHWRSRKPKRNGLMNWLILEKRVVVVVEKLVVRGVAGVWCFIVMQIV